MVTVWLVWLVWLGEKAVVAWLHQDPHDSGFTLQAVGRGLEQNFRRSAAFVVLRV